METNVRKGAGYTIEAVLVSLILFTFSFGAVEMPEGNDWSEYRDEISARDLTFMIKKSGDLDKYLKNSNVEGVQTQLNEISGSNMQVSGTVENLPLNEIRVGFHKPPSKIHINNTVPVQSGDRCDGNLVSLESNSEYPIRRTDSEYLENYHDTRLYFGDTDSEEPGGYNGQRDYDAVWVDNGTKCVFEEEEGPYNFDDIFLWGNTSDPDSTYYEFKKYDNVTEEFTVYEAEKASQIKKAMDSPVNGIETDSVINTVNFSSDGLSTYDILVFQNNETLPRIQSYSDRLESLATNTSMLFMMNMTESDTEYPLIEKIGFKWTKMNLPSASTHRATFSNYGTSEDIESYFLGLSGQQSDVSLKPGGKVISNQESTETSRDDVLFARNIQYDPSPLEDSKTTGWSSISGPCGDEFETTFSIPEENYSTDNIQVQNIDTDINSCNGPRGLKIDRNGDSEYSGPYLEDEIVKINGRRYSPDISNPTNAKLEFAGSRKVELVNHRQTLQNMTGRRAARISYEDNYEQNDIKVITSTLYWLRGDTTQFEASDSSSTVSTTAIGGISNKIFMPYKLEMRWAN